MKRWRASGTPARLFSASLPSRPPFPFPFPPSAAAAASSSFLSLITFICFLRCLLVGLFFPFIFVLLSFFPLCFANMAFVASRCFCRRSFTMWVGSCLIAPTFVGSNTMLSGWSLSKRARYHIYREREGEIYMGIYMWGL